MLLTVSFIAVVMLVCVFVLNERTGQNRWMPLITACGSVVLGFGTVGMALLY